MSPQKVKIYAQESIEFFFESQWREVKSKVDEETDDFIMNVGEDQYIEYLKSQYLLEFPTIRFEDRYVESSEVDVAGTAFPTDFHVNPNATYKKTLITFHTPYEGNIGLLKFKPSKWTGALGYEILVNTGSRTLDLHAVNFYNIPEMINARFEEFQRRISNNFDHLKKDVQIYNDGLENWIRTFINDRKQHILNKNNLLAALGVPIVKRGDIPETFAVPKPKLREKIIIKPITTEKGFKPEPTLDSHNYQKILKLINDAGKNFERLPSVYSGKGEEDLRDHILMTLDPNFEYGSASGETFNKTGKTDIQIRYDSSVVFVAECKFWTGQKGYHDTVDQLLGYLTWRDSKTSVIKFVRNKDFTATLKSVEEETIKHACFIKRNPNSDENWFNYIFKLPQDPNREIQMAVQLFHLP